MLPIFVMPHKMIPGLGADPDARPATFAVWDLRAALEAEHPTDAHVQVSVLDDAAEQPRLNKPGLPLLRERGQDVHCHAFFVDVDGPAHACDDAWRLAFDAQVAALPATLAGATWYHTRGGARLVWPLARSLSTEEFERFVPVIHDMIAQSGIVGVDRGCKEWNRLYRLPFVRRDGVDERRALTFGDGIVDPDAIGIPPEAEKPAPKAKAQREPREQPVRTPQSAEEHAAALVAADGEWTTNGDASGAAMSDVDRARRWLAKAEIPAEGLRNATAYAKACALACQFDLAYGDIETLITEYVSQFPCDSCSPEKMPSTLRSAWTYSRTQPRGTALNEPMPESKRRALMPPPISLAARRPPAVARQSPTATSDDSRADDDEPADADDAADAAEDAEADAFNDHGLTVLLNARFSDAQQMIWFGKKTAEKGLHKRVRVILAEIVSDASWVEDFDRGAAEPDRWRATGMREADWAACIRWIDKFEESLDSEPIAKPSKDDEKAPDIKIRELTQVVAIESITFDLSVAVGKDHVQVCDIVIDTLASWPKMRLVLMARVCAVLSASKGAATAWNTTLTDAMTRVQRRRATGARSPEVAVRDCAVEVLRATEHGETCEDITRGLIVPSQDEQDICFDFTNLLGRVRALMGTDAVPRRTLAAGLEEIGGAEHKVSLGVGRKRCWTLPFAAVEDDDAPF